MLCTDVLYAGSCVSKCNVQCRTWESLRTAIMSHCSERRRHTDDGEWTPTRTNQHSLLRPQAAVAGALTSVSRAAEASAASRRPEVVSATSMTP